MGNYIEFGKNKIFDFNDYTLVNFDKKEPKINILPVLEPVKTFDNDLFTKRFDKRIDYEVKGPKMIPELFRVNLEIKEIYVPPPFVPMSHSLHAEGDA